MLQLNKKYVSFKVIFRQLSKLQLNHNSTQPNVTLVSWVRHENDFAYHPTTTTPHTLNVIYISGVTDPILMKL